VKKNRKIRNLAFKTLFASLVMFEAKKLVHAFLLVSNVFCVFKDIFGTKLSVPAFEKFK
jgi:hypothetical protein